MQGLTLLSEPAEDVDRSGWISVTRDPKDEYLVALAQHTGATLLVTGDKDLLTLQTRAVAVRTVREALEALDFTHPWGETFVPAVDDKEGLHNIAAEGHSSVLLCAAGFMTAVKDRDVTRLRYLVTPESLAAWLAQLENVRGIIQSHPSLTSRPEYLTQDVAYVKIVPDPGVSMFATQEVLLDYAQLLTVQYRPRLPDPEGTGGWRVHSVGSVHWPVEDMPAVEPDDQQT